jgi:hypothetical protein
MADKKKSVIDALGLLFIALIAIILVGVLLIFKIIKI